GRGGRGRPNPGNRRGVLAGAEESAAVWDEACWPLATGTGTRGDAATGAVVLGSLTKLLACPGLRAGYVLAEDTGLIDRLRRRQPQWSVNGLACEALPDLLATVDLPAWATGMASLRDDLSRLLTTHGLSPPPAPASPAPGPPPPPPAPTRPVAAPPPRGGPPPRHATLVRDSTSFGLPGTVRIAAPDESGLARLEAALAQL